MEGLGEFFPGGAKKVFTGEETLEQFPEGSSRQEGEGRALWAKELAGAKALRHQRARYVVCQANGLGGQPRPWGKWKEMVLER